MSLSHNFSLIFVIIKPRDYGEELPPSEVNEEEEKEDGWPRGVEIAEALKLVY